MQTNDTVRAAVEQFRAQVEQFRDSTEYRAFLDALARFHAYSPNNAWLIRANRPTATYVKGFKSWIGVGRVVRKGEKGITILAPRPYTKTVQTATGEEQRPGIAFGPATVFDIEQTDPLPEHPSPFTPPSPRLLDNDAGTEHLAAIVAAVEQDGYRFTTDDPLLSVRPARGFFRPSDKTICVRPASPLDMLKTAIHETAHAYAQALDGLSYADGEVVAESVAYVVLRHLNLASDDYSVPYVTGWMDADRKSFDRGLTHIQKLSARIIGTLAA